MTDPIKQDKKLNDLQRQADREKSEWPEAEEPAGNGEGGSSGDSAL